MPSVESENGFLYMIAFSLAKGNREPSKFVYDIWWKLVNLGILYKDKGLYSEANFIKRTRELVFQTADGSLDADLKIQI
ncbi:hypothetical protein K9N08_02340 [Candidatus Gracilibacteria bacterium]|nr:hypothetical protein [Candidatus Gracilibacteria bacterium]MCF7856375.1 hypothetical protein [Candidatus Gracilibacteria bacterium]MCF7896829.1 hypothetical protein [Candidatus Gracilibacteria bacterium]